MNDTEGSVMVDGQNPDVTGDDKEQHIENQGESSSEQKTDSEQNTEGQKEGAEGESGSKGNTEGTEEEKGEQRTEKGTKLATDPLQQANQLRANAESKARMYEDFLNDPVKVEAYLNDLKKEKGGVQEKQEEDEELIDPDKIETTDDLKKFARQLKVQSQKEIEAIKKDLGSVRQGEQVKATAGKISSDIKSVQDKYSVLREFNADGTKNPDYNEELDTAIGNFFNELDLDRRTGMYRGQYSLLKIADQFMKVRGIGVKNGSQQAQTIIKDKRTGRVDTNQGGGSDGQPDETNQSAAQTIAARMKRAATRR